MSKKPKNEFSNITLGAMAVENETPKTTSWALLVLASVCLSVLLVACTQYAAALFEYQPELGPPLWSFGPKDAPSFAIYTPGEFLVWYLRFIGIPATVEVWRKVMNLSGLWVVVSTTVVTIYMVSTKNSLEPKSSTLHGSATFADFEHVERTGLLKNAFPMKVRELGRLNWIASGIQPGDSETAAKKASEIVAAEKLSADSLDALEAEGQKVDRLPFLQSRSWLAMEKARLFELTKVTQACVVGGLRDPSTQVLYPLLDSGGRHILAYAPTGSGKGVALMLPGLMTYQGSVIVHDVKKENYHLTAGVRQRKFGQRIILLEPLSEGGVSARFNPLAEVRCGYKTEVQDIDSIGIILCDPSGTAMSGGGSSSYFVTSALDLFRGAALHVLYTQPGAHMGDVLSLLASKPIKELCDEMANFDHAQGRTFYWTTDPRTGEPVFTHPNVREAFMRLSTKGDNEAGGVKGTLDTALSFFADPVVRDNTACSDFAISDITNGSVPVSMYLVAPPTMTAKTGPYFSILINMMLNRLTESMAYKNGKAVRPNKHEACFYLDEFAALAPISAIPRALGYVRSYGLRFFLVCQDPSQLKERYKEEGLKTIFANCNVRIAMTPNDLDTAKLISDYLGETTIVETNQSVSGDRMSVTLKSTSLSNSKTKRRLLDATEVMAIPEDHLIVFVAGKFPASIWAEKFRYFEDEVFNNWAKLPAPEVSERIRTVLAGVNPEKFPPVEGAVCPPPKRLEFDGIPIATKEEQAEAFSHLVTAEEIQRSGRSFDAVLGQEPDEAAHADGTAYYGEFLAEAPDAPTADAFHDGAGPTSQFLDQDDGYETLFPAANVTEEA